MATLESVIPTIQAAFSEVSKGFSGFAGVIPIDSDMSQRAALGQEIQMAEPVVSAPGDATPGESGPRAGSLGAEPSAIKIERVRNVTIPITGEQMRGMSGNVYPFLQNAFVKAIRKLVDEMDEYAGEKALKGASRAIQGNFSTIGAFAMADKAFRENKIDPAGRARINLTPNDMFNLRSIEGIWNAGYFGSDELSRYGRIAQVQGFALGTMPTGFSLAPAGGIGFTLSGDHAKGATELQVSGGTGTIKEGAIVSIAGGYYITANSVSSSSGVLKINKPGLLKDVTGGTGLSVLEQVSDSQSVAFIPEAMGLLVRPPALPDGGDSAEDSQMFVDPVSKLVIEVAVYKQYLQQTYDVRVAYGAKVFDSAGVFALDAQI